MGDMEAVEILLVEDSATDAEMTMRALKRGSVANKIVWVKDGVEALEFIQCTGAYSQRHSGNPKLILLDYKMPRLDGMDVLKRLKSEPTTKTIPVVMLTSSAEESDVVESYQLGVNGYLVKPVDFKEFINVVSHAALFWLVMNKVPA